MKTKTVHEKPWCPGGYVTKSGLLLSREHVNKVCPQTQWRAAQEVTAIIKRIMAA